MNRFCLLLPLFFFYFSFSFAQQEVTTPDGKKVLLYPDGTWKPAIPVESSANVHPVSVHNLELPKANPHSQIINHTGYTLSYNPTYHIADWVAYELTAEETVSVVERNDHFVPDPMLTSGSASNADYKGSGYDRGHLAPSADMCYSYQTKAEKY